MSPQPRAYVTLFDQRYLARAIVMLRSLRWHDPDAAVFALCFDEISSRVIATLGDLNVVVVSANDIREFEPRLAGCTERTLWAYYATQKPLLPLYVFRRRPDLATITHVDADMRFFASPAALFEEIGEASVAVSPHRFSKPYEHMTKAGRFNAGLIYWRGDEAGLKCLADYREDCLAWCERRFEPDGRYMNQGYLTGWPDRYPGVHVIRHAGVNLAPWNLAGHRLGSDAGITVDGAPLVLFHFSNLNLDPLGIWRTSTRQFGNDVKLALRAVYDPYLKEVERTERWLRHTVGHLEPARRVWDRASGEPVRRGPWPRSFEGWIGRAKWTFDPKRKPDRAAI